MRLFLLAKPLDNKIEFEIVFMHNEYLFQYGYSVEDSKIYSEWLFVNNEMVFERQKGSLEIVFGDKYEDVLKEYIRLRDDRLYLAILDYFIIDKKFRNIIDTFKEYFEQKFNIYFEIILESTIKGNSSMIGLHNEFIENECFRKKVSEYVKRIDIVIKEIIVDEEILINKRTGDEEKKPVPRAGHNIYDSEGNIVGRDGVRLY